MNLYIKSAFVNRLFKREVYLVLVGVDGGENIEVRTQVLAKISKRKPWSPKSPAFLMAMEQGFKGTIVVMDSDDPSRQLAGRINKAEKMVANSGLLSSLLQASGPTGTALARLGGMVAKVLGENEDDVLAVFPVDVDVDEDQGEVLILVDGSRRKRVELKLCVGEPAPAFSPEVPAGGHRSRITVVPWKNGRVSTAEEAIYAYSPELGLVQVRSGGQGLWFDDVGDLLDFEPESCVIVELDDPL